MMFRHCVKKDNSYMMYMYDITCMSEEFHIEGCDCTTLQR